MLEKYDLDNLAIGTLGSHSALNIFKGAKEEGFKTFCICEESDTIVYKKFPLVDKTIIVKDFTELLNESLQEQLRKLNTLLIPHGSFTAYLSTQQITDNLLANSPESFRKKVAEMVKRNLLTNSDVKKIHLQEYALGVNVYPHYFSSIINDEVEFTGVDRRYESAVDAIGRIPAKE